MHRPARALLLLHDQKSAPPARALRSAHSRAPERIGHHLWRQRGIGHLLALGVVYCQALQENAWAAGGHQQVLACAGTCT